MGRRDEIEMAVAWAAYRRDAAERVAQTTFDGDERTAAYWEAQRHQVAIDQMAAEYAEYEDD